MELASWTLLSLSGIAFLSAATATGIEVQQFPETNTVDIRENSSAVLRFHITATSLESISIVYRTNGSLHNYHPRTAFDYRALHSAIIAQCNTNTTYDCYELYIRVEGNQEIHNTSFHLVLIEMQGRNVFRQINISNFFTVKIRTALELSSTTTTSEPSLHHSTPNAARSEPSPTTTSEPSLHTIPHGITPTGQGPHPTASRQVPNSLLDTTEEQVSITGHHQSDYNDLMLIIALAVVLAALLVSCTGNMLLCCLVRRLRKSQAPLEVSG